MRPDVEHLLKFFEYGHLPETLQQVSKPFGDVADSISDIDSQETAIALRKLFEAKDAAVRAMIDSIPECTTAIAEGD